MYLSTMAGAVDPAELAMYAALLMDSDNSEMIEFLMAGMWILLRNPDNRRVLGSSFNPNPASGVAKGMMHKLNDAITLHEIHDQAQEKAAMVREQVEKAKEVQAMKKSQGEGGDSEASGSAEGSPKGSTMHSRSESHAALSEADGGEPSGKGHRHRGSESEEPSTQGSPNTLGEEGAMQKLAHGSAAATSMGVSNGAPGPDGQNRPRGGGEEGGPPEGRLEPTGVHSRTEIKKQANSVAKVGAYVCLCMCCCLWLEQAAAPGRRLRPLDCLLPAVYGSSLPNMKRGAPRKEAPVLTRATHACAPQPQGKLKTLDKRFDKQLKDNWGLETLVTVGESWLPAMLEQDEMGSATDIPVLKLFEFLVASICLFMIEVRVKGLDLE